MRSPDMIQQGTKTGWSKNSTSGDFHGTGSWTALLAAQELWSRSVLQSCSGKPGREGLQNGWQFFSFPFEIDLKDCWEEFMRPRWGGRASLFQAPLLILETIETTVQSSVPLATGRSKNRLPGVKSVMFLCFPGLKKLTWGPGHRGISRP